MRKQIKPRKVHKADKKRHHAKLANRTPDARAAKQFVHKAYESYSVNGYMDKLGVDTKGDMADGQERIE